MIRIAAITAYHIAAQQEKGIAENEEKHQDRSIQRDTDDNDSKKLRNFSLIINDRNLFPSSRRVSSRLVSSHRLRTNTSIPTYLLTYLYLSTCVKIASSVQSFRSGRRVVVVS